METELIGSVAAVLTTLSFLPQVIKTWNSRSAADLSWIWLIGFSAGLSLWLVYGFALMSWPLIAANGIVVERTLRFPYGFLENNVLILDLRTAVICGKGGWKKIKRR